MTGNPRRPITGPLRVALAGVAAIFCIPTLGFALPIGLPNVTVEDGEAVLTIQRTPGGVLSNLANHFSTDLITRSGELGLSGNAAIAERRDFFRIPGDGGSGLSSGEANRGGDGFAAPGDDRDGFANVLYDLREIEGTALTSDDDRAFAGSGPGETHERFGRSDLASLRRSKGGSGSTSVPVTAVPEPASLALLGLGLVAAAVLTRRRDGRRTARL
jgi:PEP-CTERM motif-containing protein